ncbi:MAG: prolipoprotein diacylglyceryl transferase family protein, partial [Stackebrandtia sp.]
FLGGVGAWIGARRRGIKLPPFADALAPGIVLAQAIGRLGNWFNQELYGKPTTMPWGLEINPLNQAELPQEYQGKEAYEPTFLYELLWNLGTAGLIVLLDRKFKFGKGRAFAIYVLCYGVGRFWIEGRRIDFAHDFLGLRVNEWMALAMVVGAVIYLLRVQGTRQVLVTGKDGLLTAVDWNAKAASVYAAPAEGPDPDRVGAARGEADDAEPEDAEPQDTPAEGDTGDGASDKDDDGAAGETSGSGESKKT